MFLHIGTERHPPEAVCSHPSSQAEHAPSVVRGAASHAEIRPVEGGRSQRRRAIPAADLGPNAGPLGPPGKGSPEEAVGLSPEPPSEPQKESAPEAAARRACHRPGPQRRRDEILDALERQGYLGDSRSGQGQGTGTPGDFLR